MYQIKDEEGVLIGQMRPSEIDLIQEIDVGPSDFRHWYRLTIRYNSELYSILKSSDTLSIEDDSNKTLKTDTVGTCLRLDVPWIVLDCYLMEVI